MRVLAVCNAKGGSGKTSIVCALAAACVLDGKKTLVIDMDSQGNASFSLNATTGPDIPGAFNLLNGAPPGDVIQTTEEGIDVAPANIQMNTLKTFTGSARRLRECLDRLPQKYDVILLDNPPTISEAVYNSLEACTDVLIPMQARLYDLQGMRQILAAADQFKRSNKSLQVTGIVITQYNRRSLLARQMEKNITAAAKSYNVDIIGRIRNGIAVPESQAMQESIFRYAGKSKPAQDFRELYKTIFIKK